MNRTQTHPTFLDQAVSNMRDLEVAAYKAGYLAGSIAGYAAKEKELELAKEEEGMEMAEEVEKYKDTLYPKRDEI